MPVVFHEKSFQAGQVRALVLIPDELHGDCPLPDLMARLVLLFPGCTIEALAYDEAAPLERLNLAERGLGELALLLEAWQPPLKETELFLRTLRKIVGREVPITIVLIGKPSSRTMLTSVDSDQLHIWKLKMQVLGDGNLAVQPLIMP